MAMSDPGRDFKSKPKLNKQKMLGFVVSNDDSQHPDGKKLQRVQVRIPLLDRHLSDDQLPWTVQQMGTGGSGNGGDSMSGVHVPAKNSKVWVHIESDDDPHNRFYSGYAPTEDVAGGNPLLDMDYPHTYGGVDQMGSMSFTNTTDNSINKTHVSGQVDAVDGSGERTVYSPVRVVIVSDGEVVIKGKKGVFIDGQRVDIKGPGGIRLNSKKTRAKNVASVGKRQRPKPASQAGKNTR